MIPMADAAATVGAMRDVRNMMTPWVGSGALCVGYRSETWITSVEVPPIDDLLSHNRSTQTGNLCDSGGVGGWR